MKTDNKIKMKCTFSSFYRWAGGFSNCGMSPARDVGHIINTCPLSRYGLPPWIDQKIPLHDGSWCSTRRTVHLQSSTSILQYHVHRYGTYFTTTVLLLLLLLLPIMERKCLKKKYVSIALNYLGGWLRRVLQYDCSSTTQEIGDKPRPRVPYSLSLSNQGYGNYFRI